MGRSGKLYCTNDYEISKFVNDPNYKILENGDILTRLTFSGKVSKNNIWRPAGSRRRGYHTVKYYGKMLQVHRIIYAKFKGPLERDLVINHIDGNGYNNNPSNLELVTQSKNNFHRFRPCGGKPPVIGNAVLNWETVRAIRAMRNLGHSYELICGTFNISKGHCSEIINNQIWIEGKLYA